MNKIFNTCAKENSILFCRLKAFQFQFFLPLVFVLFSFTSHAKIHKDTLTENNNSSILNQKIKLDINSGSLKSVLETLSNSYNIGFVYIEEQIPLELMINNIKGEFTLKEFLDLILKRTNLTYFLLEDQVGFTTKAFSNSIEVDSNRQAIVYPSSQSIPPDLKYYRKVTVRSIKNKNLKKRLKRTYYLKRNFSIKPVPGDSAISSFSAMQDTISSLPELTKGRMKAYNRNRSLSTQNRHSVLLRITPGMSFWKIKVNDPSKVDDVSMNQYSQFNSSISAAIQWEYNICGNFMIRPGIGYLKVNKNGTHTSTKINGYYPYVNIIEKSNYSYQYSYLTVPLGLAYKVGNKNLYIILAGQVQANLFLNSDMAYQPVYKTKYFYDLNPWGTGKEPYYTDANEPIIAEKTFFRSIIFSFSMKAEINFLLIKKNFIFIAPEVTTVGGSIYAKNAPVKENPLILGVSIGYKHIF
jgi:hypothetical protein